MPKKSPAPTRRPKLTFGGAKNLPIHCLFMEDEMHFLEEFQKKHPNAQIPPFTTLNWMAHCYTVPFKDGFEFRAMAHIFFAGRAKEVGIDPDTVKTIGEFLDIERQLFPKFFDKYEPFCRGWKSKVSELDRLILKNPEANHGDIQKQAAELGIPTDQRGEDAVKKRIRSLFWGCRKYEEARLRQMLHASPEPNVVTFTSLMFQGKHVASLREFDSRDFLFTEESWGKWPLSARMLNGTATYGTVTTLKEGYFAKDVITACGEKPPAPVPGTLPLLNIDWGEKLSFPRCFAIGETKDSSE